MSETIECNQCQQQYPYKAELAGRQVRCAKCKTSFTVADGPSPTGLADFLDEEMNAAAGAEREAARNKLDIPRPPEPVETPAAQRKRRRGKKKKKISNLRIQIAVGGTVAVFMGIGGQAKAQGPATATVALITIAVGLGLLLMSFFVGRD